MTRKRLMLGIVVLLVALVVVGVALLYIVEDGKSISDLHEQLRERLQH